jgi:hypothetical protein
MPQFILEGRDSAARIESPFVLGFIEACLFSESSCIEMADWFTPESKELVEQGQSDGNLPSDAGYDEIHPESLAKVRAHCEAWQSANAALLAAALDCPGYDETQAGRDLYFTQAGHGVGYWCRDEIEGATDSEGRDLQGLLSEAAGNKEINPFFGGHVQYDDSPFIHFDI